MTPASYRDIEEQRKQDAAEAEKNLRAHCHIPERATTPLAQMSPEELADMTPEELEQDWLSDEWNHRPMVEWVNALIQRATREAKSGTVDKAQYEAAHDLAAKYRGERDEARNELFWAKSRASKMVSVTDYAALRERLSEAERERDEARALADRLQGERDTLAWDAQVAERKLASAKHEGAREALTAMCHDIHGVGVGEVCNWTDSARCTITKFRDKHYPPSPREAVPSVTLSDGSVVTYRNEVFNRLYDGKPRGAGSSKWRIMLDDSDTGADFDALKSFAALATGGE